MLGEAFDYTEIPYEIRERARRDLRRLGKCKLVQISKYNKNPLDRHLWLILCKDEGRRVYSNWIYDSLLGGLHEGYLDMDFPKALENFAKMLRHAEKQAE